MAETTQHMTDETTYEIETDEAGNLTVTYGERRFIGGTAAPEGVETVVEPTDAEGRWFYSFNDGYLAHVEDVDENFMTMELREFPADETFTVSFQWFDEGAGSDLVQVFEKKQEVHISTLMECLTVLDMMLENYRDMQYGYRGDFTEDELDQRLMDIHRMRRSVKQAIKESDATVDVSFEDETITELMYDHFDAHLELAENEDDLERKKLALDEIEKFVTR